MIVKSVLIKQFRDIKNQSFYVGKNLTAIVGKNKSMKSTVLGVVSQTFSLTDINNPLYGKKTIDGYNLISQFSEKFKFDSKYENDRAGKHEWTLTLEDDIDNVNNPFSVISIIRDKKKPNDPPRFWKAGTKGKGSGYLQIPVYFLSLSRLYPIGESNLTYQTVATDVLSDPELKQDFDKAYASILSDPHFGKTETSIHQSKSGKLSFLGVTTDKYSYLANSAGESNIAKIIIAALSFKKIKRDTISGYVGAILCIDELDATLHPSAQIKLIDFLNKISKENNIQILFTTHSQNIIERLKQFILRNNTTNNMNHIVLFTQRTGEIVTIDTIKNIADFRKMEANLLTKPYIPKKIDVYLEDPVASKLLTKILGTKISTRLNKCPSSLGFAEYIELHTKKIPCFLNSIIVLDGDVATKGTSTQKAHIKKHKDSFILLPGKEALEIELYNTIAEMTPEEASSCLSQKQEVIMADFTSCPTGHSEKKDFCKRFYRETDVKIINELLSLWINKNKTKVHEFKNAFITMFDTLAVKTNTEPIETNSGQN
ncbi:MAG: ATP-binding protein [Endomicrobia bacterium]|nr:ATP-binding protein [Endomicrobiia bacterium]